MRRTNHTHLERRYRYAIRKSTLGVGIAVVGIFLMGTKSSQVLAEEVPVHSIETLIDEESALSEEVETPSELPPVEVNLHPAGEVALAEAGAVLEPISSNLAAGKEVTSSGIEEGTSFLASYVVDQDSATRFSGARMKANGPVDPAAPQTSQWLEVDLGDQASVDSIAIDFFQKVYASNYQVVTSANKESWQEVATRHLEASPSTVNPTDLIQFDTAKVVERYLRFTFNQVNPYAHGNSVSIKEVRVMGRMLGEEAAPTTGQNQPFVESLISRNRPATSSGVEAGTGTRPEFAFDTDAASRYAAQDMKPNGQVAADYNQTSQWLQVDLGAASRISSIEIDFFKKVYATDYEILTADEETASQWTSLVRRRELQDSQTLENQTDRIQFESPLEAKRFVRFRFDRVNRFAGGKAVSVTDIRIKGMLTEEVKAPVDPIAKLANASLAVADGRVVLTNIQEDDEYSYDIIGSAKEYVVENDGRISPYILNDQDVVMLVAARRKSDQSILPASKTNKTIRIAANHQEEVTGSNQKPSLALEIQEFLAGQGIRQLSESDKVYIDPAFKKQFDLFNQDLSDILGFSLNQSSREEATIVFQLSDQYNLKDEGYLLRVGEKIEIFAGSEKAINYAAVTLAQMLQKDGHLTQGVYRDYPNYAIRGMLLDVARIPMRMDFLKEVSRLFRWYKLNELHLHFNDTQWPASGNRADVEAWRKTEKAHRLESPTFPSLNQGDFKHDRYEGEYDFYRTTYGNPTYSLDEFRTFQAENKAAGIQILAEIDSPGHSSVYSIYALDNPDNIDYLGQPIHHPRDLEALAINKEVLPERTARAKRFITDLITGYLDEEIFDYGHIHLGVDEYWQKEGNVESFRTYLNELNALAKSKGKTLRTWGALSKFNGTTPVDKDIIFDEWAQYESVSVDRINEGFKVVNVPQPFTYVTPGRNHKDIINEQYVFEHWNPTIFNFDYANALAGEPNLLGAKGAMWGDEHAEGIEESDLYYRLEKSLAMIGFKTWNDQTNRSYLDYQTSMEATKLRKNYMPLESKSEVLVHIDADHVHDGSVVDLSNNNRKIQPVGDLTVEELDGEKWFKFTGDNHLLTDIETISLPYTIEMTFRPTAIDQGSLLFSEDGAIYLNGTGRKQDGTVASGLMLNRYFYSQFLHPQLEVGRDYRLTLAGTRQVLTLYLDGQKIVTLSHDENAPTGTDKNFRTSFNLPFKEIAKGFKGYIKDIKVYNRTSSAEEVATEALDKVNIALHKPVYDYRHHSNFWNQHIRPYHKGNITDGDTEASEGRWNSSDRDTDFFIIDLGSSQDISSIEVLFDANRLATDFKILVSDDLEEFRAIHTSSGNTQAKLAIVIQPTKARYVKFESLKRQAGKNEIAVRELRVYQDLAQAERAELARQFAEKLVDYDNQDWLTVHTVLHNKYASANTVRQMLSLVSTLADKPDEPAEPSTPVVPTPPVDEPSIPVVPTPPVDEPSTPVVPSPPVDEPSTPVVPTPPVDEPSTPVVPTPPVDEPSTPVVPTPLVAEPSTPVVPTPPVDEPSTPVVPTSPVAEPSTPVVPTSPVAEPSTPVVPAPPTTDPSDSEDLVVTEGQFVAPTSHQVPAYDWEARVTLMDWESGVKVEGSALYLYGIERVFGRLETLSDSLHYKLVFLDQAGQEVHPDGPVQLFLPVVAEVESIRLLTAEGPRELPFQLEEEGIRLTSTYGGDYVLTIASLHEKDQSIRPTNQANTKPVDSVLPKTGQEASALLFMGLASLGMASWMRRKRD
ncbi:TPA: discoidin domain-containing protein [Streptococcus suis]